VCRRFCGFSLSKPQSPRSDISLEDWYRTCKQKNVAGFKSALAGHFKKCYTGKLIAEETRVIIGCLILRQINLQEIVSIAELKTERLSWKVI
jgi:hypothetical protein